MFMSPSSDAALAHLQRIRPNDGWGIETKQDSGGGLVRLTRRNVPVTDGYFLDLHVDNNMVVVGILTGIQRSDGTVQAQKLVDGNGKLVGNHTVQLVAVTNYQRTTGPATAAGRRTTTARSASTTTTATSAAATVGELSLEQNQELVRYGIGAVLVAVAVRVISQSIAPIIFLALPLLFLFLLSTCPPVESFDVKKELKRILRGHHLPESHPEKPRGLFEQTLARIQATVVTELATLPGYTVRMENLVPGAVLLAVVVVPSVDMTYYWLGAANRWYFIYGSPNNRPASAAHHIRS